MDTHISQYRWFHLSLSVSQRIASFVLLLCTLFSFSIDARADWPTSPYQPLQLAHAFDYVDPVTSRVVYHYSTMSTAYINALSPRANVVFNGNGIRVGPDTTQCFFFGDYVKPDGLGGMIYGGVHLNEYDSTQNRNITALRIWRCDSNGTPLWGSLGVKIGECPPRPIDPYDPWREQESIEISESDGNGGAYVLYAPPPFDSTRLYLQHILPNGTKQLTGYGLPIVESAHHDNDYFSYGLKVSKNRAVWIMWWQQNYAYTLSFSPLLIRQMNTPFLLTNYYALYQGWAFFNFAALDGRACFSRRATSNSEYTTLMLNTNGSTNWESTVILDGYGNETPDAGYVTTKRRRIIRVNRIGNPMFDYSPTFDSSYISQVYANVVDSICSYGLAAYDYFDTTRRTQVRLMKLDSRGNALWDSGGKPVGLGRTGAIGLRLFPTPAGGFVCEWGDMETVFAQVINQNGVLGSGFFTSILEKPFFSLPTQVISLYPNPTNGWLRINSRILPGSQMIIYDLSGREVGTIFQPAYSSTGVTVSLPPNLSSGTYFLRLEQPNSKVTVQPITVIK